MRIILIYNDAMLFLATIVSLILVALSACWIFRA